LALGGQLAFPRLLTPDDISAAMALVDQAGWNQTPADWARFLDASPRGCFAVDSGGRLVGTSATIVYGGRLAWVGMVIVDRDHRQRGLGRVLLETACAHLDRAGILSIKLDATPAGEPLYETHGFTREQQLERWELVREPASPASVDLRPISEEALELDASVFGEDRRGLLRSLRDAAPDLAIEVADRSGLSGYALGRRGLRADHIGPWMARDERTAEQILDAFLARSARSRVFVDCVVAHPWARRILEARGFQRSRPLVRMSRGANVRGADADLLAITGPEFG
jgi:GNAT superfamily N-acetyltransferase